MSLRLLLDARGPGAVATPGGEPDDRALAELYAHAPGVLRTNVVSTLDGAATGADGLTGSINTAADHRVFALLRALSDAVIVGAGTARDEGYGRATVPAHLAFTRAGRPEAPTLVVVTASGRLPAGLVESAGGPLLVATTSACPELARLRTELGDEGVLLADAASPAQAAAPGAVPGASVDVAALLDALAARGLTRLLCEGGPRLAGEIAAAGRLDEWCATLVPRLLGGGPGRVVAGPGADVALEPLVLLEAQGALLGRWRVTPPSPDPRP